MREVDDSSNVNWLFTISHQVFIDVVSTSCYCCGCCCGCCLDEDGDDEDDEDDEDIEEFAEAMAELVAHIHSIFGNDVTFHIVID